MFIKKIVFIQNYYSIYWHENSHNCVNNLYRKAFYVKSDLKTFGFLSKLKRTYDYDARCVFCYCSKIFVRKYFFISKVVDWSSNFRFSAKTSKYFKSLLSEKLQWGFQGKILWISKMYIPRLILDSNNCSAKACRDSNSVVWM